MEGGEEGSNYSELKCTRWCHSHTHEAIPPS